VRYGLLVAQCLALQAHELRVGDGVGELGPGAVEKSRVGDDQLVEEDRTVQYVPCGGGYPYPATGAGAGGAAWASRS
jgi:hypothetical protein